MDNLFRFFKITKNLETIEKEVFNKTLLNYKGDINDYYISKIQPLLYNKNSKYLLYENYIISDWSENIHKYYSNIEINYILINIIKIRIKLSNNHFFPNYLNFDNILRKIMLKYASKKSLFKYINDNQNNKFNKKSINDISYRKVYEEDSFLSNNNITNSKYNIILDPSLYEKDKDININVTSFNMISTKNEILNNYKFKSNPIYDNNLHIIKNNNNKSMSSIIDIINKIPNQAKFNSFNHKINTNNNKFFSKKKKNQTFQIKKEKIILNSDKKNKNIPLKLLKENKVSIVAKNKLNRLVKNKNKKENVFPLVKPQKNKYNKYYASIEQFNNKKNNNDIYYNFYKEWNLNKNKELIKSIYLLSESNNLKKELFGSQKKNLYKYYNPRNSEDESSNIYINDKSKNINIISNKSTSDSEKIYLQTFSSQKSHKLKLNNNYIKNIIIKKDYNNKTFMKQTQIQSKENIY